VGHVAEDDDCSPLPHVLGPDAVGHVVGGIAVHAQGEPAPHRHLGQGGTHPDGLEAELQ